MDMLPICTKDACNGFHKSATTKQFYDEIVTPYFILPDRIRLFFSIISH